MEIDRNVNLVDYKEMEMIWKMVWPIVSYYPDICIVKFKTLTQDSQSLD
jgi:hypothetical protein